MEPWTFNKGLLVLKELDDCSNPDVGDFVYTQLWVQVHNLPSDGMYGEIGNRIRNIRCRYSFYLIYCNTIFYKKNK